MRRQGAAAGGEGAGHNGWTQYSRLCRAAGVDRLYLVLTFDCDTDGDIDVARELDRDLRARDIRAGYAVPSAQLRRSPDVWREVASHGAEFLNHGSRAHAELHDGQYRPVTFYERLSEAEVVADIEAGHNDVCQVIGAAPQGFRAPHFGSFQQPHQLDLVYRTLRRLGYTYASTTLPARALEEGPVIDEDGVVEIPTFGSYRHPQTLLDSWTYLTDRVQYVLGDEYGDLFVETVRTLTETGMPGLLVYYADPSHVYGQQPFARALDAIARYRVPSLLGREVVRRFRALGRRSG